MKDVASRSRWGPGDRPGLVARAAEALVRPAISLHAYLYASGRLRSAAAPVPVISVGNLTVGGTGKTPCVIWLVRELLRRGERPVVLSRGYGRRTGGIEVCDGRGVSSARDAGDSPGAAGKAPGDPPRDAPGDSSSVADPDVLGDEPVEIHEATGVPLVIGANRRETARRAVETCGATCLILDDGFQHRALRRDFDLVLLDATSPFGNGHLLPAGPLREPPESLARADAVLLTRANEADDPEAARSLVARAAPGVWIGFAEHRALGLVPLGGGADSGAGAPRAGDPVFVTAGIAHPESLARAVRTAGLVPVGDLFFPDHHRYTASENEAARRAASRAASSPDSHAPRGGKTATARLPIVTTAKDAVRWRAVSGFDPAGWWVLAVEFRPAAGEELLERILARIRAGSRGGDSFRNEL